MTPQEARDRANPFKNKQLRNVLLGIIAIGTGLGIGIGLQGESHWWYAALYFYGMAAFTWLVAYLLRNNP